MSYAYSMRDAYMGNLMGSGDYLEHGILTGAKRAGAKYIDRFIKNGHYVYVYAKDRMNPSLSGKPSVFKAGLSASKGTKQAVKKADAAITGAIGKANVAYEHARQALDATRNKVGTRLMGAKSWASTKMSTLKTSASGTISRGKTFVSGLSGRLKTSIGKVKTVAGPIIKKGIDYIKGIYTMAKNTINDMIAKRRANQMLYSKPKTSTTSVLNRKNQRKPSNLLYAQATPSANSVLNKKNQKNPLNLLRG